DLILVNMLGKRFYDETGGQFTANNHNSIEAYVQGSYRNTKNTKYNPNNFINAALAGIGDGHNGGGPIWAIFDADAVARERWHPNPPNVDIKAGFFFTADALSELATKIKMQYQRVPMPPGDLEQTVARYNSFVDGGVDQDFGKPRPLHKIAKPPFYAAWATPVVHDTRAGLRINAKCQVIDMNGKIIEGSILRRRVRWWLFTAWPRPCRLPGVHRRTERGVGCAHQPWGCVCAAFCFQQALSTSCCLRCFLSAVTH